MLRICKDCGKTFEGNHQAIRCPDCLNRFKHMTMRPRTCRTCHCTFLGGPRAWYCTNCRAERQREADRKYRKHGANRHIGDTDICVRCGKLYVINGSNQRYCPDCAKEAVREVANKQSIKWNHANYPADKRRAVRYASALFLICAVCGRSFQPDPKHANSVACSDACREEYSRRLSSQYGQNNKTVLREKKREYLHKKIEAMTPEEYQAYRDKVNARARENYRKRKEKQTQGDKTKTSD